MKVLTLCMALLLGASVAGCARDAILGSNLPSSLPPSVTAVTPVDNASGVSTNTAEIAAAFSEPMAARVGATNFTLTCVAPCISPVGAMSLGATSTIATLSLPAALGLEPLTTYTATISGLGSRATGLALPAPYVWHFTTGVSDDITAPTVSSTIPRVNAIGTAINGLITASFSEPMDPLTLTTASFTLECPAGTPITGTVGYAVSGNVATFTPATALPASTTCTATIAPSVTDVAHNPMVAAFSWQFTTGIAPDFAAPTVSSTIPLTNATGVAINSLITASFSEPMDPLTVTTASFTLVCPTGTPITGTVGYAVSGNVATFTPSTALPASTICTARIAPTVTDVAHNAMASAFSWQFTTGVAPDLTAPTVSSTTPLANATGVAINSLITASFSEPMDPLTVTTASFTLVCPTGTPITGTVGYAVSGNVAAFTPATALPASTTCTATIAPSVTDVAHNPMVAAFSWQFTTGIAPDLTAPTVSSTSPLVSSTGVAINSLITASFSEPMDPLTVTTASFTLVCPTGTPITGTVGYAVSGNVATFTPATALPASTTCTATIAPSVTDVAHNPMVAAFSWQFTTGIAPDLTAPTVSSTSPLANSTGVAINSLITASFSEPMDPLTVTTASFTLVCPTGTPITGTVGYAVNGNVATFTPSATLPASTICTATIAPTVTDVAHNAMASAFCWQFTTGVAPDLTAPTVSSTTPLANATGVAINSLITASFSEPMDPLTVTTASFTLVCAHRYADHRYRRLCGERQRRDLYAERRLSRRAPLYGDDCADATDVAHNALASAFSWQFTTGVAPDTTAPPLISINPADGAVGVCMNKTVNVTFSEPMDPLTVTTSTFILDVTAGASVPGTVTYDAQRNLATFDPIADLSGNPATSFTVTVKGGAGGVKDVAGNALATDKVTTSRPTHRLAPPRRRLEPQRILAHLEGMRRSPTTGGDRHQRRHRRQRTFNNHYGTDRCGGQYLHGDIEQ